MTTPKILVVEDEALIGLMLQKELSRAGYEVAGPVASAAAALEQVASNRPDLVLMDIRLAGEDDGIYAAGQIMATAPAAGAPAIIFMSGFADSATEARAMALKPVAYLIKPITIRNLKPIIAQLFQ
jgi:CheY-like chemotaxis protein